MRTTLRIPMLGLLALLCAAPPLLAADPPPTLEELAQRAARRFPQPVRVGDVVGRAVLRPVEAQPVLARVESVGRRSDGGVELVLKTGGTLGFGGRLVVVPADAMALMGEFVAAMDYSPEQLEALPTVAAPPAALPAAETVRMGIVRPFH